MKQLISILMSLLLLTSSTGITYAQHFCGEFEMMAKITLGQEKMSCGMAMDDACGDEENETHSCCDNEYSQIDTDDNFAASDLDFQLITEFVSGFITVFVLQTEIRITKEQSFYAQYHPPPLIKDIPVLYETFLI